MGVFVELFFGLGVKGVVRLIDSSSVLMLISSYREPAKNACLNSSDRLHGVRRPGVATETSSPLSGA